MKELQAFSLILAELSVSMQGQEAIRVVSVANSGVIKIVLDSEKVSLVEAMKNDVFDRFIRSDKASVDSDPRSNSIFVTIRP
jgi:hypothetical protein